MGGTRQALRAQADGVEVIIASGYEAGGHAHARPVHTMVLGPSVCAAVDLPVVLAGGICDGADLAAALALGADAVALGTRFVAPHGPCRAEVSMSWRRSPAPRSTTI